MTKPCERPYPGEEASALEIRLLADEYRSAARCLWEHRQPGKPLSLAPFRFSAVHAIELYLTAYLRLSGYPNGELRAMQHGLCDRIRLAQRAGLRLRKRTLANAALIDGNREYLIARYGPERVRDLSQPNQVSALLEEVSGKVAAALPVSATPSPESGGGHRGTPSARSLTP